MNHAPDLHVVTSWLNNLARLTRHRRKAPSPEELHEHKAELALYATMLAKDFPSAAFTADSLHHVVTGCAFFPPYDQVRASLAHWWRLRTQHGEVQGRHRCVPEGMDGFWLGYWQRRMREIMAMNDPRKAQGARDNLESCLRTYAPRAWAHVMGQRRTTMAGQGGLQGAIQGEIPMGLSEHHQGENDGARI